MLAPILRRSCPEESMAVDTEHAKREFNIDEALAGIEDAVQPWPKAALFELAELGFQSPFEQLVACMISIRTRDETTLPVAQRLFQKARTPAQMLALSPDDIDACITASSFHQAKARQIHEIARRVVDDHGGELPCDDDLLQSLPGVGPKCAHLVLGIACGQGHISVDVHVHRVTNRWGYVRTTTPEATMAALEAVLPERHWIDINRLLVPFGKHICTGKLPRCSTCPVLDMCQQIGVDRSR